MTRIKTKRLNRSVSCHMRSQSITCHPTQVNVPHVNRSEADWYSTNLSKKDKRPSWIWCWLYTKICRQSPIHVVTNWLWPDQELNPWSL